MIAVRMPREVYRRALRLMRPAESALRRLIVIAAREVVVRRRVGSALQGASFPRGARDPDKIRAFPLFDPRLHPKPPAPKSANAANIRWLGDPPEPRQPASDLVDGAALNRRLARFGRALENLPREARRLARWRLCHPKQLRRPMRPGRPPGTRARPFHAIDHILKEVQHLALIAYVDTS